MRGVRIMEKKFKLGPLKKREKKEKASGEKPSIKLARKNRTGSYQFLLQPAYSVQLPCYLWKLITI